MPKRKNLILFTMVIAIIAILTASKALAQNCDGPTCCNTASGWTIEVKAGPYSVDPVTNGCSIPGSSPPIYVPCYRTDYEICQPGTSPGSGCSANGLNQLLFAVKTCAPNQIRFFPIGDFHPDDDIFDPGEGDPTLGFLEGYLQAYVIRIEPNQQNGQWSILSDTPFTDLTTFALKAGKGKKAVSEYCEVTGLDCPRTSSDAGVASSQCVLVTETTAGNLYMGVVRGPDGCSVNAAEVSFYINSPNCDAQDSCSEGIPATGCRYDDAVLGCDAPGNEEASICIDPPEGGFQFCADFGGGCQECFEFRSGSPTCLKYTTSSGTRIKSCFLEDGTTCSWKKCCKNGDETPACGY